MRATAEAHVFCPAKVNLYLAVTGRRPDGFHELVSVVAPLRFGDRLVARWGRAGEPDSLACDADWLDCGADNLVLRAAAAYRAKAGAKSTAGDAGRAGRGVRFTLVKRIPAGAGLGGGSSDAAGALLALNALTGGALGAAELAEAAAEVGSDCPLFLHRGPVVMRGRGERVEPLPAGAAARVSGARVLVFKPDFAVPTPWAYQRLAAGGPAAYDDPGAVEERLRAWASGAGGVADLMYNRLEISVFQKYLALPALLGDLRSGGGIPCLMSGSGSACFALLGGGVDAGGLLRRIREAWGEEIFALVCELL